MVNFYLIVLPAVVILSAPLSYLLYAGIVYLRDLKGLRKYPNQNYLSPFTNLAYCWELARKHPIIHSRRLYLNHTLKDQRVIRLGPNWISFGRGRAARDIYGYSSSCKKSTIYDTLAGGGGAHLNNISEKAFHKFRRSMVSHYYSPKNQHHWVQSWVLDSTADLMKVIDSKCTKPLGPYEQPKTVDLSLDLVHWGYTYACEVIVKIGLSKDLHLIEKGDDTITIEEPSGGRRDVSIVESFHCAGRAAGTVIWDHERFTMWVRVMKILSKKFAQNLKGGGDAHIAMTKLVLERMHRHQKGEELNDLFMPWLEGRNGNEPDISTRDKIAETEQMVGAGIDGPGGSIIMTMYNLIKHPRTFQKLREELDTCLPPKPAVATWTEVKSLPYLKACIDEGMRLHPPVATDLVRRTPPEGLVIDGISVPGDTDVSISAYTSHRDPDIFTDPERWHPERWIENRDTDRMKEMLSAWVPFSAGYRMCIGRNISIVTQACAIGTLVHNYDFALPKNDWEIEFEEWFNLWPKQCPVKVWKRERFAIS